MTQGELRAWGDALADRRPLTQEAFDDA